MSSKYYNDAIIGNQNLKATFSKTGEMLRLHYPELDYKQFIKEFTIGVKVNDSQIIYLHDDSNNRYKQYYTKNTNILNTEIVNTYFKYKITQTDFVLIKDNILVKKYVIKNNNKLDLDFNFIVRSSLLTNDNNMISCKVHENGMIQYTHDYSLLTFSKAKLNGHRINDVDSQIYEGILSDKDYIGMSPDSAISYHIGNIKPGKEVTFSLFLKIEKNSDINSIYELEDKIDELKTSSVAQKYNQVKAYWEKYVKEHNTLKLDSEPMTKDSRIEEIYIRTILLFPLLMNEETGGIAASAEVDEIRKKSGRYAYCWPRDAIFMTKALDTLGMTKESDKFYKIFCKKTQSDVGMWEQRYYTDCRLAPTWGYQIDETASVIYGVNEHYKHTKDKAVITDNIKMCEKAYDFILKYLEHIFNEKEEDKVKESIKETSRKKSSKIYEHVSYDIWEECESVHAYSLAAIFGALTSMQEMYDVISKDYDKKENRLKLEQIKKKKTKIKEEQNNIKEYITNNLMDKHKVFFRNIKDKKIDLSLIGLSIPFKVFDPKDKAIKNTVEKINMTLRTYTGGYLRYEKDNYMEGKDPWPLLTLWMALYYLEVDDEEKLNECLQFVINSSSNLGFLAEQVNNEKMEPSWVIGLGWAHAMFILLIDRIINR